MDEDFDFIDFLEAEDFDDEDDGDPFDQCWSGGAYSPGVEECEFCLMSEVCEADWLASLDKKGVIAVSEEKGQWAIVELMGHKVIAGLVQKDEMLGKPMLRVDVPATSAYPTFTQFYGEAALYCVTFTSEEVARRVAEQCKVNPVSIYVPDLITVEQHRAEIEALRQKMAGLRRSLLAAVEIEPEFDVIDEGEEQDEDDGEVL